jgi:preprotein translocase subunit SecE
VNEFVKLGIWVVVVGVVFALLWRRGVLARISNYTLETREELRKCTWPTIQELRASTAVVLVAVALIGVYVAGVDFVISLLIRLIT